MAKLTYLQLTNRVLARINLPVITDVTAATGQSLVITQLLNEAQNELFTEINWYSLYSTRTFVTVASTDTYAVATDFGRNIDLMDVTNNRMLIEDAVKNMDEVDPDANQTGTPEVFTLQGSNFRLWPIPAGVYTIRERYWILPTTLAANSDTSTLPIEAENALLHWTLYKTHDYMNKLENADRARLEFERLLLRARVSNDKILDKMNIFSPPSGRDGIAMPQFPSTYGARYW